MRATYWIIGCTLCIAGIGSAAATNLETQDMDSSRAAIDSASPRESNGSGGDVLGLNRDSPPVGNSDSAGSLPTHGGDHSGGASPAPAPARRPHLGWQSLLPGSIQ
jgi:hypothetical protein